MKRTFLALYILLLITSISFACENTTVSAIMTNSSKFDGKVVCVKGLASNVKFKTSKKGNPYTTFSISDKEGISLNVFSHGTLSVEEGDNVNVTGRYAVEKSVGRYTFHNEIDVISVEPVK
jgi:hypothetical protein